MPAGSYSRSLIAVLFLLLLTASPARTDERSGPVPMESFESFPAGTITKITAACGVFESEAGQSIIDDKHASTGTKCLQLTGGERTSLILSVSEMAETSGQLTFQAERWTSRSPFSFRIEKDSGNGWKEIFNGDNSVRVGRAFLNDIRIPLEDKSIQKLRFTCTSPAGTGILIDDLRIAPAVPQQIVSVEVVPLTIPALVRAPASPLVHLKVVTSGTLQPLSIRQLTATINHQGEPVPVTALGLSGSPATMPDQTTAIGSTANNVKVDSSLQLAEGENDLWLVGSIHPRINLDETISASISAIQFSNNHVETLNHPPSVQRPGIALRLGQDDGVHTSRIPGLAVTPVGTLIAVYDLRHRSGGDLPGDIDVGMSRSTDGGRTWEQTRTIMDQGDAPAWRYDGIGDPAVLVDRNTGTIWVAATWSHGNRSWIGSGPGLKPEETGQLMLVRSDDDGVTWSAPINITKQIKKPEWSFVLQGPGSGITMQDGTLVFAAQYQDPPNSQNRTAHRLPHSTILYSRDHGQSWQIGTGAFDDTTEAQVAEIEPGVLMLNCRYNRESARVIMTTRDLGKTWQEHPTSRGALIEPRACMASLLDSGNSAAANDWLLFSNPDSTAARQRMMIKASPDRGQSWPAQYRLLLDEGRGGGYSCMAMIDKDTVGILYEGSQAHMTFQRIPLQQVTGFSATTNAAAEPVGNQPLDVFILTGQSNSLGTVDPADVDSPLPPPSSADKAIPFFWSNRSTRPGPTADHLLGTSGGRFLSLQPQQGEGSNPVFWGPEISFARSLYASGKHNFAVVKASRAGGGNTFWNKGSADDHMYRHLLDTVREAVSNIPGDRPVRLAAIMILQGESDGPAEAAIAGDRMQLLLRNLQRDLPLAKQTRLLIAEIAAAGRTQDVVRRTQQAAAAADDNIHYVSTIDLQSQLYDGLHFNKAAKLEIGYRLAKQWLDISSIPHNTFELDQYFQQNMMLQADQPVTVQGTAAPHTRITGMLRKDSPAGPEFTATATTNPQGRWELTFPPQQASSDLYKLAVSNGIQSLQLHNLLCGDIWICAGQSNMEWPLRQTTNAARTLASAALPDLRLLHLPPGTTGTSRPFPPEQLERLTPEQFFRGEWTESNPQSAADFSAVGWHFGQALLSATARPVGLISCAVGGSPAEAWIPLQALRQHPHLSDLAAPAWLNNPLLGEFCPLRGRQNLQVHLAAGRRIPGTQSAPNHPFRPGFLWQAGMREMLTRPFRGVVWYQGESNAETEERVQQHSHLLPLLVREWRNRAGREFPFVFAQLPAIDRPHWPLFRDQQRRMLQQLNRTGMAITIDTGDRNDVHPRLKQPVGERLAKAAYALLQDTADTVPYTGPLPVEIKCSGKQLTITFRHCGKSLRSADEQPLRHFEVADDQGRFHPGSATITGPDMITVQSQNVATPTAVRYAWQPFPTPAVNLVNSATLPASPFQLIVAR